MGGTITSTEAAAVKAKKENRDRDFTQLMEQANQLRSRMAARVPVKGSLSFLDSRGTPHAMGIDVGMEQSMKEPRSHIEGATPATAIWSFGVVVDPFSPAGRPILLDRRIPVGDFLAAGTIEGLLNRLLEAQFQIAAEQKQKTQPNLPAGRAHPARREHRAEHGRGRTDQDRVRGPQEAGRRSGRPGRRRPRRHRPGQRACASRPGPSTPTRSSSR